MENKIPKEKTEADEKLKSDVERFLSEGGEIYECSTGETGENALDARARLRRYTIKGKGL